MAYILYDPHTAHVGTGQRMYLAKDGSICAKLQSARPFATRAQADAAKVGVAARFVAREVFAAQVWEQLVEALRRTWNMLSEQALQWSNTPSMTAEQVRTFMRNYIEDQAPGENHSRAQWWDPLTESEKSTALSEAFPAGMYGADQ